MLYRLLASTWQPWVLSTASQTPPQQYAGSLRSSGMSAHVLLGRSGHTASISTGADVQLQGIQQLSQAQLAYSQSSTCRRNAVPQAAALPSPSPSLSHNTLTPLPLLLPVQSAREALKAKLKSDPSFRRELRKRVTDALIAKGREEGTKTAEYNFDSYMLTGETQRHTAQDSHRLDSSVSSSSCSSSLWL